MRPESKPPNAQIAGESQAARSLTIQRRRQVAGLLLIALMILLASLWRAGLLTVFPRGWWRLW
jgi:hypothetical protein